MKFKRTTWNLKICLKISIATIYLESFNISFELQLFSFDFDYESGLQKYNDTQHSIILFFCQLKTICNSSRMWNSDTKHRTAQTAYTYTQTSAD